MANKNSKQLQVTDQRYQIAMKEMDLKHSEKISELESKLATKRDKETARREYEYDARKKLYEAYEPLLFQFNELAENALRRVIALARASRQGKLEENSGWLSTSGYYLDNTMYRLLIPLATFNLMQKKLTMFDLKLNPFFHQQYLLAKLLYHTFAHDIRLASFDPEIKNYDPNSILKEGSNFRKQGIFLNSTFLATQKSYIIIAGLTKAFGRKREIV